MRQPDHEYEERSFGDIQRAIDFENRSSVLFRMNHWFYPPHPDISLTRNSIL